VKAIKARAHSVHKSRHAKLGVHSTSNHPGYASGGAQHPHKGHSASDEKADTALIHSMVKPDALNRASGGRAHKGKKGGTHVNILVGQPGGGGAGAGPTVMPPPGAGPGPMPPMASRPMPPMGAGGPPPGIGGAPVLPPRKHGGRARNC
jgi:hypothetical protein